MAAAANAGSSVARLSRTNGKSKLRLPSSGYTATANTDFFARFCWITCCSVAVENGAPAGSADHLAKASEVLGGVERLISAITATRARFLPGLSLEVKELTGSKQSKPPTLPTG